MNLWVPSVIHPSGKCKIVLIAAHSWATFRESFQVRWNILLARIDYMMHYHDFLSQFSLEETTEIEQWPDTFQSVYSSLNAHCNYRLKFLTV